MTMRRARVKAEGEAFYHVMSRCALQQHLLTDDVKGMFMKILRRAEYFSGVKIVNYCIMDNHFHLLLKIPKSSEVSEVDLDNRIKVLYGVKKAGAIFKRWDLLKTIGSRTVVENERNAFRKRMFDLSEFMKTFKQRFSLWYCTNHGNLEGTIWQGPFHSVLVEGNHDALAAISAYIALNPVRAGIVKNACDYSWSGYGAAANGDRAAKKTLLSAYGGSATIDKKWASYQSMIAETECCGDEPDTIGQKGHVFGTNNNRGEENIDGNGTLSIDTGESYMANNAHATTKQGANALKHRNSQISRGIAFGSKCFVTSAIRSASKTNEVLTYPLAFCLGERKTQLFCAGRRRA